jgi:hypothetical protein
MNVKSSLIRVGVEFNVVFNVIFALVLQDRLVESGSHDAVVF